jgi:hypothetical protein
MVPNFRQNLLARKVADSATQVSRASVASKSLFPSSYRISLKGQESTS